MLQSYKIHLQDLFKNRVRSISNFVQLGVVVVVVVLNTQRTDLVLFNMYKKNIFTTFII